MIYGALDAADSLIVEDNHLSAHSNRSAGQWQQRHIHVLLPEVADQVDTMEDHQWLQARFYLEIHRIGPSLRTACRLAYEHRIHHVLNVRFDSGFQI